MVLGAVVLAAAWTASGQQEQPPPPAKAPGLADLDLQELMNIEVTSVSRRPERLLDAAASIFVISAEDIRRSGATSLPEALRLAPNLEIGRASTPGYAITARGFANNSANKLLVLIDGRSVYSPLFSGVFWDAQDVMLEDVERIEVISGPGGTLWGSNAVNGVINIITRSAKQPADMLATAAAGNLQSSAGLRYGGTAGARGSYRLFARTFDRGHTSTESGVRKDDAMHQLQGGFRADWERAADQIVVLGNAYKGSEGQPPPGAIAITGVKLDLGIIPISGVNVLGRWKHVLAGGGNVSVQAYYDRTERTVPPTFAEKLDIVDLQVQHTLRVRGAHAVAWGGEYRYAIDHVVNSAIFAFLPGRLNQKWASVFAQDEIALRPGLRLTVGTRVERNDYTGSELLPNGRFAWKATERQVLWGAVSRTVRAPSRLDRDAFVPATPPFLLDGGRDVRSEVAWVYELGYRAQPTASLSGSIALFRAFYDHLRTQEIAPSRTFFLFANGMTGTTSGVEVWGSWQAAKSLRLSAGFSGLRERLRLRPGSNDVGAPAAQEGKDPEASWRLRASVDLAQSAEVDLMLRHVSALANPAVPAYTVVDLRYGRQFGRDVEVALIGRNLFEGRHREFTAALTASEFGREVLLQIVARFDLRRRSP
jgi:iron complex outermembrane receptor protein